MLRNIFILNSAICVITKISHTLFSSIEVGKPVLIMLVIFLEFLVELSVLHQSRKHCHNDRCTVPSGAVTGIARNCFHGLIIYTGKNRSVILVVYRKMKERRSLGRFVFCNRFTVKDADSTFSTSVSASANSMQRFDNRRRKCGYCSVSIFG